MTAACFFCGGRLGSAWQVAVVDGNGWRWESACRSCMWRKPPAPRPRRVFGRVSRWRRPDFDRRYLAKWIVEGGARAPRPVSGPHSGAVGHGPPAAAG